MADQIRRAHELRPDVLVAAGGDGTVNAAANHCVDHGIPLGILPFGTRNHFARDAGIPRATEDAVRTIARRRTRRVDVAEINGRVFLNNSSIGAYPRLVHQREELRGPHGEGKWIATARAGFSVLRRHPTLHVEIETPAGIVRRRTPFVFVGNNPYDLRFFVLGRRHRLDTGELSVYYGRRAGRSASLRLAMRSLLGRLDQARDFEGFTIPQLQLHSRRSSLRVSYDGEIRRMRLPLRYRSRPRALRLIVPGGRGGRR
jgi:diacylglycerol kinase family enzyme